MSNVRCLSKPEVMLSGSVVWLTLVVERTFVLGGQRGPQATDEVYFVVVDYVFDAFVRSVTSNCFSLSTHGTILRFEHVGLRSVQ